MGAATPPLPRSIQSCPAGQRHNTQETAPSKTKDLSAYFLERGIFQRLIRIAAMATALLAIVPSDAQIAGPQNNSAVSPQPALLNQYCITCHNQRAKTAGLALDTMDFEHVGKDAAVWEKVVRKIRTGMMPPSGASRPER